MCPDGPGAGSSDCNNMAAQKSRTDSILVQKSQKTVVWRNGVPLECSIDGSQNINDCVDIGNPIPKVTEVEKKGPEGAVEKLKENAEKQAGGLLSQMPNNKARQPWYCSIDGAQSPSECNDIPSEHAGLAQQPWDEKSLPLCP